MNRFRPQPDRTCLEDLSAPISHFASCRQDHEFMYRQLAQTHRREPQMDPTFWDRTANIWAGGMARSRASLVQLAATFRGKCASMAVVAVLLLGLQALPAPSRSTAPIDGGYTTPVQSDSPTQAKIDPTSPTNMAVAAGQPVVATSQEDAPAAPIQAAGQTSAQQPTASAPSAPAPTPTEPDTDTPAPSDDLVSVSVLTDEEPLVTVVLPGISVKVL